MYFETLSSAKRSWPAGGSESRSYQLRPVIESAQVKRTIGVSGPRSSTRAGNEVRVRIGDGRGVTGSVDLDHHVNTALREKQDASVIKKNSGS